VGPDMVVHIYNPSYLGRGGKRIMVWDCLGLKYKILSEKQTESKRTWVVCLKWWSACLASARPYVQTPVPQRIKNL
jgi:hypothetical protein